jgi:aryl-alcohol dehydrogenase-like predicted oxidoreductase
VGITTSEGRRHAEIERVMRTQPIDFVQLSYNLLDREAEQRLLPLAPSAASPCSPTARSAGRAAARAARHPLPGWAAEIGCRTGRRWR